MRNERIVSIEALVASVVTNKNKNGEGSSNSDANDVNLTIGTPARGSYSNPYTFALPPNNGGIYFGGDTIAGAGRGEKIFFTTTVMLLLLENSNR